MKKSKNKTRKKQKKILFLSPLPPPFYGSAMSSEMCLNILKNSKNFDVKNIKLNYSKEMSDVGRINLNKIKGIFKVKKQIKKELKKFNPDTIYFVPATSSFGLIRDYLFIKEIKKNWNEKILFHLRSRISEEDWNNPIFRKLYLGMFKGEKVIVLDKILKKDLHGIIPDKNIFILPNAIKNEISEKGIDKIRKQRQKNKNFNILFLSNMDEDKGWFKLLQTCKILKEKGINFNCNFIGAWPSNKEKNKFYSFIEKNFLQNNVKYLSIKTGKEKNNILEKSDVLVFPTEYKLETFGRVIIEAMMFSLPVIANGIASIPTTIQDGKTGFVVKNIKEAVEAIKKIDQIDRRECRKWVEKNFTIKKMVDDYEKLYYKVLRKNKKL